MSRYPKLAIVVPLYNEEKVIELSYEKLSTFLINLINKKIISENSFICFVDDGSQDQTWNILSKKLNNSNLTKAIKLSKNYGHQNAILAGMEYVKEDIECVVTIDGDLQQDINAIYDFINCFKNGSEIVYGVRQDRDTDSFFKKNSSLVFYKMMETFGVNIIKNHADYRLLSQRALMSLLEYKERNLFLRGVIVDLGYKTTIINHQVFDREAGESKYTLKKMLSLALTAITSFSITPIRIVSLIGFFVVFLSMLVSSYIFIIYLSGTALPGWSSTVLPIYFIGGVQLLSLGIIGEYIGKIYIEVKRRPRYIIEETKN